MLLLKARSSLNGCGQVRPNGDLGVSYCSIRSPRIQPYGIVDFVVAGIRYRELIIGPESSRVSSQEKDLVRWICVFQVHHRRVVSDAVG